VGGMRTEQRTYCDAVSFSPRNHTVTFTAESLPVPVVHLSCFFLHPLHLCVTSRDAVRQLLRVHARLGAAEGRDEKAAEAAGGRGTAPAEASLATQGRLQSLQPRLLDAALCHGEAKAKKFQHCAFTVLSLQASAQM
jgi:hypothetical protein